jgi:hypothetical protein
MSEFIFMLTRDDLTVENAQQVYDEVCDAGLRYVGFKDVGLPFDQLKTLTGAIHDGGQEVMLEVVSERKEDELRSAHAALDLGVDYLLGGTHAEEVTGILDGADIRYCPYPGHVVGHPSQLRGDIDEIVESARDLAAMNGVSGLDLLAYRYNGAVDKLVEAVVNAVSIPVIIAGNIDSEVKIRYLASLEVWGFTVGSAIFQGTFFSTHASTRGQVETVLAASQASGSS